MAFYQREYSQRLRNPRTAVLLALLLGPIGMFYATVTWAAIMLFVNIVLGLITYGIAILILWPVGARVAYKAVCSRNQKLLAQQMELPEESGPSVKSYPQKLYARIPDKQSLGRPTTSSVRNLSANKFLAGGRVLARLGTGILRSARAKCLSGSLVNDIRSKYSGKAYRSTSLLSSQPDQGNQIAGNDALESFESRLLSLKALRDKGLIDESEFRAKKKAILDEL